ncbi:MAG: FlgO family outer membrane protein [Candidatus Entotheonellia bacterium]
MSSETPRTRGLIWLIFLSILLTPLLSMAQESELAKRISELADRLAFASKGQVLSIRGNQAYLDMGEQAGVVEGTRLEVVRLGDPLVVGGKVIGHEETIIGEVEIIRVREGIAIAKLVKQEQPFQKGDRAYQMKKKVQRVALAEFPYADGFNDFTRNVQEMLYTNLIQKGMSVVERQKLEEVLREQKIAYTGIVDLATAAQVGKLLGVEGVVVGSVTDLGNTVALTARLIDVEKGTAVTAARVELAKTTDLGALIAKGGRGMPAKDPAAVISPAVATVAPPSASTSEQRLALSKPLKETAIVLAKKAARGLNPNEVDAGQSMVAEYNSLVRYSKVVLKTDPFTEALEETKEG